MPSITKLAVGQDRDTDPDWDDSCSHDSGCQSAVSKPASMCEGHPEAAARVHSRHRLPFACMCLDRQSVTNSTCSTKDSLGSIDFGLPQGAQTGCVTQSQIVTFWWSSLAVACTLLVLAVAVPVVLGVYSLHLIDEPPVIDKSIKAFQIPNHLTSRRLDALDKAAADMRSYIYWYNKNRTTRGKRNTDFTKQHQRRVSGGRLHEKLQGHRLQEIVQHHSDEEFPHFSLHSRRRREVVSDRRIPRVTQSSRKSKIEIVYIAQGRDDEGNHGNIFSRQRLQDIHEIERRIQQRVGYHDYCFVDYNRWHSNPSLDQIGGCAPLNSLLTYFYPSVTSDNQVHYDGLGNTLDDVNNSLSLAMTHQSFYWYVDEQINSTYRQSRLLRAEVHFGFPLPGRLA